MEIDLSEWAEISTKDENDIQAMPEPNDLPSTDQPGITTLLVQLITETKKIAKALNENRPESPWLKAEEAARYLRFSVNHFRKIAKDHQIPVYHPVRYRRDDLDRFMEDNDCFKKPTGRVKTMWGKSSSKHQSTPRPDGRYMEPIPDWAATQVFEDRVTRKEKSLPQMSVRLSKVIQARREMER